MVCFCFLLGFSTIFLRSLIPDCGGLVDSTSESEPEVVDSNFIGAVFCVFFGRCWLLRRAGSVRDPGVVVSGTSHL